MRIEDVGYFLWFFSNKSIFCVTYSFHHLSNRFSFYFRGVDFLSHYFFLKNCINLSFLSITLHSCICRYHFHVRQSSSIAVTTKDAHLLREDNLMVLSSPSNHLIITAKAYIYNKPLTEKRCRMSFWIHVFNILM